MTDIAISVRNLIKDFEVYARPSDLAIEVLTGRKRHRIFRALDGVNFDVMRGEVLGVIGSNGAGKSTLLKIITGVLEPTAGKIELKGRVSAILELGLGFNPEYSGRDNIYLSGLLYGMDRQEIDRKIDSIIEFSGLEAFIGQPVKTYSSGMHSRLAFSIATAVDPDILIIDEALAAGDAAFVQKSMHRIQTLCRSGHTVLVVSHGTSVLAQLCRRVMWLDRGRLRAIGPALNVIQTYDLAAHQASDKQSWLEHVTEDLDDASTTELAQQDGVPSGPIEAGEAAPKTIFRRGPFLIERVELLDNRGKPTARLATLDPFRIRISYRCEGDLPEETLGVALAINRRDDLAPVVQWFSQNLRPGEDRDEYDQAAWRVKPSRHGVIDLYYPYMPLCSGDYILSIGLLANRPGNWMFYEYRHLYYHLAVDDGGIGVGAPVFLEPIVGHQVTEGSAPPTAGEAAAPFDNSPFEAEAPATLRQEIQRVCVEEGGYPDSWPHHETCPACGRLNLFPHFSKYGFNHSRCADCGFICVDPHPPDEVIHKLYAGGYYTNIREFYELPRLRSTRQGSAYSVPRDILHLVVQHVSSGTPRGRWLDVGGGIGAFAELIKTMVPSWDVFLNEFNPRSCELAAEIPGIAVVSDPPDRLAAAGVTYDVISAMAVLEHIAQPEQFLRDYALLLPQGGTLVIGVPQFTRLNAAVSQGASPNAVPPFHLSLFAEDNLRTLLERVGLFSEIDIRQLGDTAFRLFEHVGDGDLWDVPIPTALDPIPRSLQLRPYTAAESLAVSVLAEAGKKLNDFFADTDGRLYLIVFARRA